MYFKRVQVYKIAFRSLVLTLLYCFYTQTPIRSLDQTLLSTEYSVVAEKYATVKYNATKNFVIRLYEYISSINHKRLSFTGVMAR